MQSLCAKCPHLVLPASVVHIGHLAFYQSTHLISVHAPGVKMVGVHAFGSCTSLVSVCLSPSLTTIGESAFKCCHSLTSIGLPASITTIETETFMFCNALSTVTMPGVKEIGNRAFYQCTALTTIGSPTSLETIGECAFDYCESLVSIDLPNSLVTVKQFAFYGCGRLDIATKERINTINPLALEQYLVEL